MLTASELAELFVKLKLTPRDLLRRRDATKAGLSGDELLAAMAEQPTLLQRPILVKGSRAAVGRPAETLSELL